MNYNKIKEIKKTYFGYQDVAKVLAIGRESAKVACARFVKQGAIVRIKRNIYILRERWQNLTIEGKFAFANLIQVPSYVSLMTALSYYEATTQVQRDFIESISIHRTKSVEIDKNIFNYSKIKRPLYFGFNKEKGIFIASPEKAFLDALYLKSLQRYSFDLTSIDFGKLKTAEIKKILKKYPVKTQQLYERECYGYLKKT